MTKLIVAFRNFANAHKSRKSVSYSQFGETFTREIIALKFDFIRIFRITDSFKMYSRN